MIVIDDAKISKFLVVSEELVMVMMMMTMMMLMLMLMQMTFNMVG